MREAFINILGLGLALSVVVAWLWRMVIKQTPDYDIEEYLHGSWASLALVSMGRSYRNHKRLIGSWDNLHVVIDLRVRRTSLFSLSEDYLILLSRSTLPDNQAITTCRDTCKQESFHAVLSGAWNVGILEEGCAIGRALFHIPADRHVRAPIASKSALEDVLRELKIALLKSHDG